MQKILIIEDDPILSSALRDNLLYEGYTIIQAKDGQEGLTRAESEKPDLILLDIILPTMNGLDMLAKLRKDPWGKNVPVILLSNLSEPPVVPGTPLEEVPKYLRKVDWKIEDVKKMIRAKLNERDSSALLG